MKKQLDQVKAFHEAFGHPVADKPTLVEKDLWFLRGTLLGEELEEYAEACDEGNIVGVADALADQLYILLGTMLVHGMQDKIEEIFDEVQRSNMSKLGSDGKPIYREDGKVLKGPDFTEPNIADIING
jgi:predicted HAD superfamily Cof-like phosphohydrolase